MKRILLTLLFVLVCTASAFAQPVADDPTTPVQWYGSVAGVIAATALGVSVLKRVLGNVSGLNSIPTWAYAVVVSGVLTFLTVQVWHTLPGDLWQMMSQVVLGAGAASGFYEWLTSPGTTLKQSAQAAGVKVSR